jgi:hypothetical protein
MATDNPLEIMRRACRLQERIAKRELDKGERGNIAKAAEASMSAAMLAKEIAAAEYRLGINSSRPAVDKIEVEFVEGPGTAAERDRLKEENQLLRAQLETFRQQQAPSDSAGSSQPIDTPSPAAPSGPSNVVAMESREQRIARLRYEAGDRPQALRSPFDNDYDRDFGLSGGGTRFDNKVPLP